MINDNDLHELLEFKSEHPVLSIYLNTEPTQGNADTYKLHLRNLLKEVNLTEDISAVERFFSHEYKWSGRGVAVFSCAPQKYFKAYPLAVPVHNLIYVENTPSVKPLVSLLDNYGGYGVALVDKQGARLFYYHLGELIEYDGVLGEEVKHTKHGGASAVPGRRGGTAGQTHYEDEVIGRNMKEMADFAVHFFEDHHVRRVLIGGTEDNVSMFRTLLPKSWQSLVMGTFSMPMTASHTEVLSKALQIGLEAERQREKHLVDDVVTRAAKGASAVTGLAETLDAVNNGRVQRLIILDGFHKVGYLCTACNWIALTNVGSCPHCGGKIEPAQDVIDLAVLSVIKHGGEIEVVADSPELEKAGKLGALLRY
jgi:hypothetical protein